MFTPTSPAAQPSPDQQQLLRLNLDFLALLTQVSPADSCLPQLGLRPESATALARCDAAGLQRMAGCSFSLFSLSLHRADLWQQVITRTQSPENRFAMPTIESALGHSCNGFMECAMFFAWHLAQQMPQQARLLLGMSADTMDIITRLELWQCLHIAHSQHKLLSPRWRQHPFFWADLLRYADSGDKQYLRFVQLLGSQLMAQELEPSVILRLSSID